MALYHIDKNLRVRKVVNYRRLFLMAMGMMIVLLIMLLYSVNNVRLEIQNVHTRDTILVEDLPLTDSAITHELTKLGCVLPNVAVAQFKIETGHYQSDICRENKNIAGIRNSASELAIGKNRGHNVYRTYRDCLRDYVRIQNKYLSKIDGKYAEAKDYTTKIKQVK
jgi:hypothetical protein